MPPKARQQINFLMFYQLSIANPVSLTGSCKTLKSTRRCTSSTSERQRDPERGEGESALAENRIQRPSRKPLRIPYSPLITLMNQSHTVTPDKMNSASLRATLLKTDLAPAAIQRSAAGLMSHYDRIPSIAVDEWRQCLATCNTDQLLPLLYVANEVIQTSKRNRGNKFLEAFSPVLGSSLRLACNRDRSIVEKVRRVVKIWGDRRVFSVRFVSDVLNGLEEFRPESSSSSDVQPQQSSSSRAASSSSAAEHGRILSPAGRSSSGVGATSTKSSSSAGASMSPRPGKATPISAMDYNDDIFGSPSGENLLKIEVGDLTAATAAATGQSSSTASFRKDESDSKAGIKRKRPSQKSSASAKRSLIAKKKTSLVDVLDELERLNTQYRLCQGIVASIPESHLTTDSADMESMVGDELRDMYKKVSEAEQVLTRQGIKMHIIAQRRYQLERELVKFIPQLRLAMRQDEEDLKVCENLESKINLLLPFHGVAKETREQKREEERKIQEAAGAEAKKREQEELKKRELEETLKATESGAGMVWNPITKEYQAVNDETMESWRD